MKKSFIFLLSLVVVIGLLIGFNGLARDIEEDDTGDIDPGEVIISPEGDQPEDTTEEEIEEVTIDEDITAEDLGISEPKLLPDNPFYFVKNFWRGVRTTFTFNKVKKTELRLRYANERLIEAKKLAEKTGKEEVFQKTLQKYQDDIEKIEIRVEKFKEKAKDNPKIDKFLDKFTEKTVKHQILMDRLEKNLSDKPEVLERIRSVKEKSLEHFGEVMERLEEKDKIPERLEKNMEKIEGSKYKNFKNLEVLMKLEDRVPEQAKEAIQQAQENAIKRLHGNLEEMSSEDQERFGKYLEGVSGDQTTHLEIMERLKERKLTPILKEKLENNRGEIQIRVENLKESLLRLCPEGDSSTTIEELKGCIREKIPEQEAGEATPIKERVICPLLWAPVCGKDGRTYSNACFAKAAGVEIAYKGKCKVERFCKDLCGDGKCQEIVCLAEGCPCAETPRTCPQDCEKSKDETAAINWVNSDIVCKVEIHETPIKQFPRPEGEFTDEDVEKTVAEFMDFCNRVNTIFDDSGLSVEEADKIYDILHKADIIRDGSYGMPSPDLPPIPAFTLKDIKNRVAIRKIGENHYEIFYYYTSCGVNYNYVEIKIENNELSEILNEYNLPSTMKSIERWSLSFPC